MKNEINIELRSEILEYSLQLEKAVNDLLLFQLGIFDGGKSTKLFGKKQGITFKNKVDLLFDIDVLDKHENAEFELLMIFRNKFLHDIDCNSFQTIVSDFDNGLKNRFKKFIGTGQDITDESICREACAKLFLKNIRTIRNKFAARKKAAEEKYEIFQLQNDHIIYMIDLFFDLTKELSLILESAELEDEKTRNLSKLIFAKYQQYINKYQEDKDINSIRDRLHTFLVDANKMKSYFGIVKLKEGEVPDFSTYVNVEESNR